MMSSDEEGYLSSSSFDLEDVGPRLWQLAQTASAAPAPHQGGQSATQSAPQGTTRSSQPRLQVQPSTRGDGKPIITYEQIFRLRNHRDHIPVQELALPRQGDGRAPARTTRFRFEAPFRDEDKLAACKVILEQLKPKPGGWTKSEQQPIISYPKERGNVKCVDVTLRTKAEFERFMDYTPELRFRGHRLTEMFCGAPLHPWEVPILVDDLPEPTTSKAWDDALAPYGHILEAWAEYELFQNQPRRFTGTIACLFHCSPWQGRLELPSWLQLGEGEYPLLYSNKDKHCTICGAQAAEYHETKNCGKFGMQRQADCE